MIYPGVVAMEMSTAFGSEPFHGDIECGHIPFLKPSV
jgi:hypothetical protein